MNGFRGKVGSAGRAGDKRSGSATVFAVVGAVTLVLALLGIFTRQAGFLAAFWPANAVLVGLFARAPRLARPAGWAGALVGFAVADLATGSSFAKMVMLTAANFAEITVAWFVLSRISREHLRLREPSSIIYVFSACLAGAAATGAVGIWPGVELFDQPATEAALTWFASALASSMAILPLVLAAPSSREGGDSRVNLLRESRRAGGPLLALIASLVAGLAVRGPAAIMFAEPALLYCALFAGLFQTTIFNFIAIAWTMIAITSSDILLLGELPPARTILSVQVGLSLLAMGPIAVAATLASREEALVRLRRSASRDALTGSLTRGAFEREATALLSRLCADGRPVAVLMMDLDRFKEINDTYGHPAGDRVLAEFAESTGRSLRDSDLFGRVGGEEFAIVLPGVSSEIASVVAERIRTRFAELEIKHDSYRLKATVSIGSAYFERAPADMAGALAAADRALYRAKQSGRNAVVTRDVDGSDWSKRPQGVPG